MIEVMIALVIVGILASLAMVQFNTYREQAKLRLSAQKVFQILSWARLQSEKTGDTLLVQFALPNITVYQDRNGSGTIDAGEFILSETLENSVALYTGNSASPPDAAIAATGTTGLAAGAGTCGANVCCDKTGGLTNPGWDNSVVAVCVRTMPAMPSVLEDGAIYLGSTKSSVKEKWAVVMNGAKSPNQSLWSTTAQSPTVADWNRVR